MNNEQTIEKLKQMRLTAMAQLHQQHVRDNGSADITADEVGDSAPWVPETAAQ